MDLNLPQPIVPQRQGQPFEEFVLARNNFRGWLDVWKLELWPDMTTKKGDIYQFREKNKRKFVEVIQKELERLGSIKVSFSLRQEFTREVYDELEVEERDYEERQTQTIKHYFQSFQPAIFMRGDSEERIGEKIDEFLEQVRGEIENWSEAGSGWTAGGINLVYIEVARYRSLRGGTYLPLPASLAKKKAIINVRNKNEKCIQWAIRAALFPVEKDAQRPRKYPVNDGIDYTGIDFPTPIKQIDRLEAQNEFLAINVFGWEKNNVVVYRLSKNEKSISRINLMLIESEETQHYCCIKRISALLFDQTKTLMQSTTVRYA